MRPGDSKESPSHRARHWRLISALAISAVPTPPHASPLVLIAGVVACLPLSALARRSVSLPRLVVEAFAVTVAVTGAVWAGWLLLL